METEISEVFACPQCGGDNYVAWAPKESSRRIACVHHYEERRTPQPSKDDRGNDITIVMVTNAGSYFVVTRGQGVRGVERSREEGKSWREAKVVAIADAEV